MRPSQRQGHPLVRDSTGAQVGVSPSLSSILAAVHFVFLNAAGDPPGFDCSSYSFGN